MLAEDCTLDNAELLEQLQLAIEFIKGSNFQNARELLENIISYEDISVASDIVLNAYVQLISVYLSQNKINEASQKLENGLARYPDAEWLLVHDAQISQRTGDIKNALLKWDSIRKRFPKQSIAYVQAGYCYLEENQVDEAERIFTLGSEMFGSDLFLQVGLATVYQKKKMVAKAYVQWSKIKQDFSDFMPAYVNLGNIMIETGELKEAAELFRNVISKYPEKQEGYEGLASIAQREGNLNEALHLWDDVLDRHPESVQANLQKGNILLKNTEYEDAKKHFYIVLNLSPGLTPALIGLGRADESINASIGRMPWTGERYIPTITGDIMLEHLHRYLLASNYSKDKRVLDIASGEGYGTKLLSQVATSVVGVDIDEASIEYAKKKYADDKVSFLCGTCANIPLADDSVDVVVSFETIEHHDEHTKMFEEITRVLSDDGVLVLSSPDKLLYSDLPDNDNEFHEKELYYDELVELATAHFEDVIILEQQVQYGSFMRACRVTNNAPEKHIAYTTLNSNKESSASFNYEGNTITQYAGMPNPKYFVLIATNSKTSKTASLSSSFTMDVTQSGQYKNLIDGHRLFLNQKKIA